VSHEASSLYDKHSMDVGVKRHLEVMQRITGHAPPTCPWRVQYSPLVREVLAAMEHEENGNLAVGIGSDPPAILVDAIGEYKRALQAVRNDDAKIAIDAAKARRG
jgi:hypothetical protein